VFASHGHDLVTSVVRVLVPAKGARITFHGACSPFPTSTAAMAGN